MASATDFLGDCRVAVAMASEGRGNGHESFRRNCRGNCRGLPWVTVVGTTEVATDIVAARAVAIAVAFAVKVS